MNSLNLISFVITLVVLSGCGLMKNDRIPEQSPNHQALELSNQHPSIYLKTRSSTFRSGVQVLGVFEASAFPAFIRELPSGSEIGTLRVRFEDETYDLAYLDEVVPNRAQHEEETNLRVVTNSSNGRIALELRAAPEEGVRRVEEPITVLSAPTEYCSQVETVEIDAARFLFIPRQVAECGTQGQCLVEIEAPRGSARRKVEIPIAQEGLKMKCIEKKTHYQRSELLLNRRIPVEAIVHLNSQSKGEFDELRFGL